MFGITSNIDKVIEKFKAIGTGANNVDVSEALLLGVNAAKAQMTFRIFNEGKDFQNEGIGKYRGKKTRFAKKPSRPLTGKEEAVKKFLFGSQTDFSEYELLRIKSGRQVRYKDLELTGTLKRGIITAKVSPTKVVCSIPSASLFKISQYQQEQTGKTIFALSNEERQLLKTNTSEALKQIYVRVFNS